MIQLAQGNILDDSSSALVIPVNTVGVAGKGLALAFKLKFPEWYKSYREQCDNGSLIVGRPILHTFDNFQEVRYFISFPTKMYWRNPSEFGWISVGLDNLRKLIFKHHIKTIAIPALGCGLGGLDWPTIEKLITDKLGDLKNTEISLYSPQ